MSGFRKNRTQYTADKIIDGLISHHTYWHNHGREKGQFNYAFLRKLDPALVSAIDCKRYFDGLENAF